MSIETPSEILPSHNLKSLFKNLLSQQLLLEEQLEPQETQNIIHTQEIEEQQQNINLEIHTQEKQESGKGSGNTVSYRQGGKGGGSQQQKPGNYLFKITGGIIITIILINIIIQKIKKKKNINEFNYLQI